MKAPIWTTALILVLTAATTASSQSQGIRWLQDLEEAKRIAAQSNRLVLVHFWANWCQPCVRLEQEVFAKPGVASSLERYFVPVKLNTDHFPASAQRMGVVSLPTDVILAPNGQLLARINSPSTADAYVAQMLQIASRPAGPPAAAYAGGVPPAQPAATPPLVAARPAGGPYAPPLQVGYPAPGQTPMAVGGPTQPAAAVPFAGGPYSAPGPPAARIPGGAPTGIAPAGAAANRPLEPPVIGGPTDPFATRPASPPSVTAPSRPAANPPSWETNVPIESQPAVSPSASTQSTLPLALDGYCPVTLKQQQKWTPGDRRWGVNHRGRLYLFTSQQAQQQFFQDPDTFSPVFSGVDPVVAIDQGRAVDGRRQHGVFFGGRVYLFASETSLQTFSRNPRHYADGVRQAMQQESGRLGTR